MLLVLEEVIEVKSGSNFFFLKFDVGNGGIFIFGLIGGIQVGVCLISLVIE